MVDYQFLNAFKFKTGLTLKNRVVMSPMTTMTSFYNGMVSTDEVNYYAARAAGLGMVITGVANVTESGKGFEGELSVASDEMIPGLQRLANAIHQNGTKAILQIFHAGRKSNHKILRGEEPVSASAIAASHPADSEIPRALSNKEILHIIDSFGQATQRAITAGFDGVELHGANTYLLQQFFSPNSNQRNDDWGGNRQKRMRFSMAVINETLKIAKKSPRPFVVGYRISPEEIETPGIRLADSLYFVDQIKDLVNYVHLSMGSYKRTSLNDKTNTQTILSQFAELTKEHLPLIGVGSVEKASDANAVLADGADLVALGRELLREPQWVQKVIAGDEESIRNTISPVDMNELAIPSVMQVYLQTAFKSVMNFTTDPNAPVDYQNTLAPMEGGKKEH
ncbi:NADH-dependent flavin oxidoreductase [Liquorilactobacillus oeni]|uniref:NADH flavin oxidoreductase n=1 Tax=Liquorilactobacillus oeni DSM 19972 TaxID=1423777 RepID=A0A0R1MJP4_9LACO|nr:NADH-dependent flavin oxidoreductase [Liquorilactobacillus oeni]KRL05402.1 NADH flavin oxidoreductase [Liquorilactobacillus oeni DSM 19972]